MKKEKKNKKKKLMFAGGIALTAAGIMIIPTLTKKYSNKLYKSLTKTDDIDIDNMGPEIIKESENE